MEGIDIGELMHIIRRDLNGGRGMSCPPFSPENVAIVIDSDEAAVNDWEEDISDLDVESLTDGEWSMTEPEDGDYGSIVLEDIGGMDVVKDDFELGKHRFRKKF